MRHFFCPAAEARLVRPLWRKLSRGLTFAIVLLALAGGVAPTLRLGTIFERDAGRFATAVIFAASYLALAVGRIPGLAIDRAGVALVGASLLVACGALSLEQAYKAVDFDTLTLLLGMMILVANLRLSGFRHCRRLDHAPGSPATRLAGCGDDHRGGVLCLSRQ